jgi:hypothetical protein
MRTRSFIAAMALVGLSVVPTEAGLPASVAQNLDRVVTPSEPGDFQGSYTMSLITMVQKPGGKSREEVEIVADINGPPDGSQTRRLVRYLENGADVTEEQRQKFEKADASKNNDDDDEDFANPFGDTADLYQFAPPETLDSFIVVAFEPAPGHEDDDKIAIGKVAWDPVTLEPAWLEMAAVHPPKPLKKLGIRLEFARQGEHIYVTRMVTDGLAKVLLMQREFHMDLRFEDIRPAGSIAEQ